MSHSSWAPARMRWPRLDWPGWARRAVGGSYFAVATWLLLAPPAQLPVVNRLLPHQDKLAHLVIFVALAVVVRWSLPRERGRSQLVILAVLALYAGAIEALQPLLTSAQRSFEWGDLACNGVGLSGGWRLFPILAAK